MRDTYSGFMLVPHGYCAEGRLQLWVGAHSETVPESLWLRCTLQDSAADSTTEIAVMLDREVPSLRFTLVMVPVIPGKRYHFSLRTKNETGGETGEDVELADAECRARPGNLADGFNVWFGSCFSGREDKGALAKAFNALPQNHRPDVSFLGGDQVYLDIAVTAAGWGATGPYFRGLSFFGSKHLAALSAEALKAELEKIFSVEYHRNWSSGLHPVLRCGNHHFLAGDHEFWNDYPNIPGYFSGLKKENLRETWKAYAQALFDAYQSPSGNASDTFSIGNELEFFYLDTYLQRGQGFDAKFTDDVTLERVCKWLRTLRCPGVLVLPAPLLTKWHLRKGETLKDRIKNALTAWRVNAGLGDHSFADSSQYVPLVQALHDCTQDILILAGDVHYSRLAQMELNGKQVVEVVSTPLSCLSSAGCEPETEPKFFPHRPVADICEAVNYLSVGSFRKQLFGHIAISDNNFATVNFSRTADGVRAEVVCWLVNQREENGHPKVSWEMRDIVLQRRGAESDRATVPDEVVADVVS